jgi:shikimate kinase
MIRIILLGFMGTGKSTLGLKLSKKMNIPFFDSDQEIEKLENISVKEIFNKKGEDYFRQKEKEFIEKMKLENDFILSVGGGLPCYNNLMYELNQLGKTIYIKASPKFLYSRLKTDKKNRPLLLNLDDNQLLEYIELKLDEREELYMKANLTIETKDLTANKLIHLLHLPQKS